METNAEVVYLDELLTKDLQNIKVLSSNTKFACLEDVVNNINEFLNNYDDKEQISAEQWNGIFKFIEDNMKNINIKTLVSYFTILFNMRLNYGISNIDGKICHEHMIKKYQVLIYNTMSSFDQGVSGQISLMFDLYTNLFFSVTDLDASDPANTRKLLFLIDVFKSIISLITSTYKFAIVNSSEVITKFYKIWNIVDSLLVKFNNQLDAGFKKNIIISLEYLINRYFNNLIEIDKDSDEIDKTVGIFIDLLIEEKTKDTPSSFYLKLIDNYLLFNIVNTSKVLREKTGNGLEKTKLYELFLNLFKALNDRSENKEYYALLHHILLNYLQTTVSNMSVEYENKYKEGQKYELYIQKTIMSVVLILNLNDFKLKNDNESFFKFLVVLVNDFGYTITDFKIWEIILALVDSNTESINSRFLLKTIVTNDDILKNLNLNCVEKIVKLIERVIMETIDKQDDSLLDDNLLLNYFNYFWNISDYLNFLIKSNLNFVQDIDPEKNAYYSTWECLFDSLFKIFDQIADYGNHNNLKISVLTIYFNLINSSIEIVDNASFTFFIKEKMIDNKILSNTNLILKCFSKNEGVLDLVLKELLILVKVNHLPYLSFYKDIIELGNKNGNNNVLYVLTKNYYKLLEKMELEQYSNNSLKTKLYEIWLSYDFSFNNETIINEIKNTNTEQKSQYDLITEYMKGYLLINNLLSVDNKISAQYVETNLRIIDKCLKFPILPNINGKDGNNMTILQKTCLENIKLLLNAKDNTIVLEQLSEITHYKTVIKNLISEKIFSKLPEKLNHRLPTFKRLSYEALLLLNENCKNIVNPNKTVAKKLFDLIIDVDETKGPQEDCPEMWVLASEAIIHVLNMEHSDDKKTFLIVFNTMLESDYKTDDKFNTLYSLYSKIFFTNIYNLKSLNKEFNEVCSNIVKITLAKPLVPVYNIFASKIQLESKVDLDKFDEENLWLLLSEQESDKNEANNEKNLMKLVRNDLNNNMAVIKDANSEDNKFLEFINLNYKLTHKYYPV